VIHALQDRIEKLEGPDAARIVADLRRAAEQRIAQAVFRPQEDWEGRQDSASVADIGRCP
jgi:hypothetical protein